MKLCGADIKEKDDDWLSFWKTEHRPRREVKQGVAYLFPFYFSKYTIGERSRCLMSVCDTSKWNNLTLISPPGVREDLRSNIVLLFPQTVIDQSLIF